MFIDEPEKHLHPSATAQVLKALRRLNPDGQIWLATHSIHVLSMFAPEDIWLVENGFARWVGKNPESALRSLIGDEDAQLRLVDFLAFPAAFAATQFAGECLGAPPVAMTPAHDPQANQVRIAVQKLAELKGRLRVLDWGAGKGRLAAALAGLDVDYLAYEPNSQTREECLRNVANHFQASDATVFSNFSRTLDLNASVDVVVLCNVLHEIDPADWLTCFGPDGHISNVLHDDGHLLVVEDYRLPHGEKAHAHGFLLLDRDELQKMFAAGESEIITSAVTGRENRLRAHLISRSAVIRYGNETRAPALETLKTRAMAEMSDIGQREKTTINYHSGREYALWVHLFANASLALATAGKE